MKTNFFIHKVIKITLAASLFVVGCGAKKSEPFANSLIAVVSNEQDTVSLSKDLTLMPGDINVIYEAIVAAQKTNVRESWGVESYQCVTDYDYDRFKKEDVASKIAKKIIVKKDIMAAILTLRMMTETEREKVTSQWRKPLRKTWAQLGRISPDGQTDAGQLEETEIANAIVDIVMQCCSDPNWNPNK